MARCSSRDAWDVIPGSGSNGYHFDLGYIGRLPGDQNVYPPSRNYCPASSQAAGPRPRRGPIRVRAHSSGVSSRGRRFLHFFEEIVPTGKFFPPPQVC